MPQPVYSDVHVAAALTQISVAYLQSADHYIADRVFPNVPVQHQTDKYFVWNKGDFFRDEAQLRADATESAGTGFNLTTQSYSANVWALHKDVGDQVRRNADPAVDLDLVTTRTLMQKLLIRRDRFFMSQFMKTGLWGTDKTGQATSDSTHVVFWDDDANGDPFSDLALGMTTVLQNTGYMPNTLVMGWPVFQALRKHPLIIDRIKYSQPTWTGTISEQLLAQAFDIDRVLVSKGVYNSASEGNTDSFGFMMGKDALLCYSAPDPGLMQPSAGYTFPWEGFTGMNSMGVRILQIPLPWLGANTIRTEAEMSFDMQAVGTDLGYFYKSVVS